MSDEARFIRKILSIGDNGSRKVAIEDHSPNLSSTTIMDLYAEAKKDFPNMPDYKGAKAILAGLKAVEGSILISANTPPTLEFTVPTGTPIPKSYKGIHVH